MYQLIIILTLAIHSATSELSRMAIGYTPKSIIVGTEDGTIQRCRFDDINHCKELHSLNSPVLSLAITGEFIYTGLKSTLHRCHLHENQTCTRFHKADSPINAVTISEANVFVGTHKGVIYRCGLRKSEDCEIFYEAITSIYSLTAFEDFLYVGSENSLLSCPLYETEMCTELINVTSRINTLNYDSEFIYAGLQNGTVMRCNLNSDNCTNLYTTHSEIKALDVFGDYLQVALTSGDIIRYNLGQNESLTFSKEDGPILSLVSIYGTGKITPHYLGESRNCTWQWFGDCPPFVNYFDVESRDALQLHVKDGLLYNSQGELFDTSKADYCHTGRKAIFVMDPVGNIYSSNKHPIMLLHHSSLMAGNPVAAAGELSVHEGVVKSASSCSGHYRQSIELTKQMISALRRQGYDKEFDMLDCRRMRLMIDLYYNKLDFYYETKYGPNYVRPVHEWEEEQFII